MTCVTPVPSFLTAVDFDITTIAEFIMLKMTTTSLKDSQP